MKKRARVPEEYEEYFKTGRHKRVLNAERQSAERFADQMTRTWSNDASEAASV